MTCRMRNGLAGVRRGFAGLLACVALTASAAGTKTGLPVPDSVVEEAPVGRLIIRYREGVKLAGQGSATAVTERLDAASAVTRSAALGSVDGVRYLKSVSARLHVVTLDQPVDAAQAQALMQRLRTDPAVEEVLVDLRVRPHFIPADPLYTSSQQWHLGNSSQIRGAINASSAWDASSGAGVVVAVLDGGYRPHADLVANVLAGYDFVSADSASAYGGNIYWSANDGNARDADAQDPGDWVSAADAAAGYCSQADSSWHGTHVAGLVAAQGNNGVGGLGVAYGSRLLPVRVLGRCGGYMSDIQAGARWAAGLSVPGVPTNTTPARILSLSLGVAGSCDSITQSVVDEIRALNISIVASTGNGYTTSITAPASCQGVIAVTAHTREGDSADYANVGTGTDISAPGGGENVTSGVATTVLNRGVISTGNSGLTTPVSDSFMSYEGTSMAAPQVAGVLALLAALRPDLPMTDLETVVTQTARAFPAGLYCATHSGHCGAGLLDAGAAVTSVQTYVHTNASSAASSGGGGGCTVAPPGQADAGLPLLLLVAVTVLFWRWRRPA